MSVTHPRTPVVAPVLLLGAALVLLPACSSSGTDLRTAMETVCDDGTVTGAPDELTCEVDGAEVEGTTYAEDPSDDLDYWITDVVQSADSYSVAWAVGRDGGDHVVLTVVDLDDRTDVLAPLEAEGFEVGLDDPVGVPS